MSNDLPDWQSIVSSPSEALLEAADRLTESGIIGVSAAYSTTFGTVTGDFVLTTNGYASGTIKDNYGWDQAEFLASPTTSAVRGDVDWWALRAPRQISQLADRWIRLDRDIDWANPDQGGAFAVDIVDTLSPDALADAIRAIAPLASADMSEISDDYDIFGQIALTAGKWTVVLNGSAPHDITGIWMPLVGGIIDRSAVQDLASVPQTDDDDVPLWDEAGRPTGINVAITTRSGHAGALQIRADRVLADDDRFAIGPPAQVGLTEHASRVGNLLLDTATALDDPDNPGQALNNVLAGLTELEPVIVTKPPEVVIGVDVSPILTPAIVLINVLTARVANLEKTSRDTVISTLRDQLDAAARHSPPSNGPAAEV
ncbi:hypothetical protein [Nocardia veterana]|uniref:Uncharacterized protein n=1 Tax=Nocardia veterana TaxID=132249 RepID=A0A7X6RG00_9NOCA|nr:hypothetical protein [Nocardia veterana]NKY84501.1 hypothetical protein [Nocardia veterana]